MVTNIVPSKILIGISLNPDESKDLLSWAIRVFAHPNDTILAIHVLAGEEWKHRGLTRKKQSQIRQAKAHVISVLAEFATTCLSSQVNLEAKVGFSSSISRGLVDEAKSVSADILLLRGRSRKITRYCFDRAPETCAVTSMGKCVQQNKNPNFAGEINQMSNRWMKNNNQIGRADYSVSSPATSCRNNSPRTVLDESQFTEDDSFSFADSTFSESPSPSQAQYKTWMPYKLIYSLFASSLRKRNLIHSDKEKQQPLLKCFTYDEIVNATNSFHPDNIIGRGGYSEVYRGDLPDGRTIAVKCLAKDNKDAKKDKEFLMELGVISHISHPNTATLLGCCVENGLYLILNFSQNGNLATALHDRTSLDWPNRYRIALGVAKGLHYLHKCCKHRIIHRDIKASNVLLGPNYEPKITDFGLAKWLPNKWSHHAVIRIEGTFGYLAPEYFMHGIVDEKTDVFAFGVLLLEIITAEDLSIHPSKTSYYGYAKPLMESGAIEELVDPKLEGKYDSDQVYRVVLTASYCVRQSSAWRPTMSEVLELLSTGKDSELAKSWRIPKFTSDDLDKFSMIYGYDVPMDTAILDDFL